MSAATRIVYWDSSIFIALLFFESRAIGAVEKIFRNLYATNTVLTINTSLELEVVDAIRRRVVKHVGAGTSPKAAEKMTDYITADFFDMINTLSEAGKIKRVKNTALVDDYHKKIMDILLDHPGRISANARGQLRHIGAGYRDIEHAYHAMLANADEFYTLDAGFKSIMDDSAFAKLLFVILSNSADSGILDSMQAARGAAHNAGND